MATCCISRHREQVGQGSLPKSGSLFGKRLGWGTRAKAGPLSLEEPVQCRMSYRVER